MSFKNKFKKIKKKLLTIYDSSDIIIKSPRATRNKKLKSLINTRL